MLSERTIDRINNALKDKTFNYKGNIISDMEGEFDFKVKIIGYRQMYRIGTLYPYIRVEINLTKFKDKLSSILFKAFTEIREKSTDLTTFFNSIFPLKKGVEDYLSSVFHVLDPDNYTNIVIDKVEMTDSLKKQDIVEQRSMRKVTRDVIRDIVNFLKRKKAGDFYLPEEGFYSSEKYPLDFSVELTLKINTKNEGYKINADFVPDEDVVEILIIFNPNTLEKNLYGIIGELNEIVTHELEHGSQSYRGELEGFTNEKMKPFKYYTQPHEIPAQIKGFRRLSKLRKKSFESVVRDWFETHRDIHKLNNKEEEKIISILIKKNQE